MITPENRDEVLPRFFHLSKREAAEVAAAIRPDESAPRRAVVTVVRAAAGAVPRATEPAPLPLGTGRSSGAGVQLEGRPHANSAPPPAAMMSQAGVPLAPPVLPAPPRTPVREDRSVTVPLTADLRRLHVTVSKTFLEKLEKARASLSHSRPGASAEAILEAGLDLLLAKDAKRKAQTPRPKAEPRPCKPDTVPAHVRREVWERDGGRCQWPLHSGGICGSTLRCELDHVVPEACGGPATVDNLRVLCRTHDDHAARGWFGDDWMGRFTRPRGSRTGPRSAPLNRTSSP